MPDVQSDTVYGENSNTRGGGGAGHRICPWKTTLYPAFIGRTGIVNHDFNAGLT